MQFSQYLNHYIRQLGCTGKELAAAAQVSEGTVSRYRSGQRIPAPESDAVGRIAQGLEHLARASQISLSPSSVPERLRTSLNNGISIDRSTYLAHLNGLVQRLEIPNKELAKALNFDPSYISRILSGQRSPAERQKFTAQVSDYIAGICTEENRRILLAQLLDCDPASLEEITARKRKVDAWFGLYRSESSEGSVHDSISDPGEDVCRSGSLPKLILIRGNSGSGKSTLADRLQKQLGRNTLVISQDRVRREMLWVKDGADTLALPLLMDLLRYGKEHCAYVILEGILHSAWYRPLFEAAKSIYREQIYAYYYDLPFEETLRRHATKPNHSDFGEAEMLRWWNEKDFMGIIPERVLTQALSLDQAVDVILWDVLSIGS